MRRVLVDAARARGSHKRCGAVVHVTLDAAAVASPDHDGALLALDEVLSRLSEVDARKGRVPADGCSYLDGQCPNPEPVPRIVRSITCVIHAVIDLSRQRTGDPDNCE